MTTARFEELAEDFALFDDWEDRYSAVIDLGKAMPPLPEAAKTEAAKVRGCASQVWLVMGARPGPDGAARLTIEGDSDAHIVRGLVAVMRALYEGLTPEEALAVDPQAALRRLGLADHLSSQRSNGVRAMAERIRAQAAALLSASAPGGGGAGG